MINFRPKFIHKHSGDTIIEVLICIAIVGMVIATAYALANRALRQGVFAAERVEALKLAEAQIENLKYRQQKTDPTQWKVFTLTTTANNFCLDTNANDPNDPAWQPILNTGSNPDDLVTKSASPTGGYDAVCNPATSSNGKFFINITIPTDLNSPYALNPTYLIKVRWSANDGGVNQSQVYYRF